jgi:hypothetical protein
MERADFIHLVRLGEYASADDSHAYRRKVVLFATLGYLWVVGCFFLGIGVAWWALGRLAHGTFHAGNIGMLVVAAGLLWSSLRALWVRLPAPQGVEIGKADAPVLFDALERIRKKISGPSIHHVLLDDKFNASISQRPRYGFFGGAVNYLTIGLPLLMAIDRQRFLAILAHEYGHLRGDHGQFAAWIYRTRLSWTLLERHMRDDQNLVSVATQAFLRWYFPRFLAKTFALARQDEYDADRIAGKLLGQPVAGAALTEIAVKGAWLQDQFWPLHWRGAANSSQPVGPFAAMRRMLALPPEAGFSRDALRQALRQISDVADTHPGLSDRLESLNARQELPAWSTRVALDVLGNGTQWLEHFDKQWCRDHATDWKQHHAYLSRVRQRADVLIASLERNNADEMTELGQLKRRLGLTAEMLACFERALRLSPSHTGALRGLASCLPPAEHALRMDCLQQLFDDSPTNRWWACNAAVQTLEDGLATDNADGKALKLWRDRLRQAQEAEDRAWQEMTETPFFQSISRHDLNEFELGECRSDLARCQPIARAWLVRKNLTEFTYRRCYLLFIDLPSLKDDERYELCRGLERTLDLPGPVLVLWAGYSPTLQDIQKSAFETIFVRALK